MFNLTEKLTLQRNSSLAGAIKIAAKMITTCDCPDKRWKALQELRKLQNMIV